MTIWVSRVELSEARRHLLNLDDRTYSSGDWLARFVPGLSNGLPSGFMSCRLPVCGGAASGEPQVMLSMRTSRPFQNKDCLCRTEGVLALEV